MSARRVHIGPSERGMVMIASLLLLLVVTILAISMFRSYGVQEKIAGNLREKQRALLAAEDAQQYAEYWLASGTNSSSVKDCTTEINANANEGQVCNTLQTDFATVPWMNGASRVGVLYTPPNLPIAAAGAVGTYIATPEFYITYLGPSKANSQDSVYQIDSVGYGGTADAVAVVESTFQLQPAVPCYTCNGQ